MEVMAKLQTVKQKSYDHFSLKRKDVANCTNNTAAPTAPPPSPIVSGVLLFVRKSQSALKSFPLRTLKFHSQPHFLHLLQYASFR